MQRMRWIALFWLLLSCGISILWASLLNPSKPDWMGDFKGVYFDTRCLFQRDDPYKEGEPLRLYEAEEGRALPDALGLRQVLTLDVYLPTVSVFVAPFAMLAWGPAHLLWTIVTAGCLLAAAFLMWGAGADHAPAVSCVLICFLLANSEAMFGSGNSAGIAVGLCMVAAWCFLKERFVPVGILCLAASLCIKPHDACLVWLYFLLAGAANRKRALQTLLVTAVLGLSSVLWVTHVAPNWMNELHSNLVAASAPGGLSNPNPDSVSGGSVGMVINLQAAISVFRIDPKIYNSASYLVCGALLLAWLIRTLRLRFSERGAWLALAAVVPLTMLVTYHRPQDAKLLLLTVPACAMLWAEGGPTGWIALLVNTAGIVLTADIPMAILLVFAKGLHLPVEGLWGKVLTLLLMHPASLILLVMGVFYLWVYVRLGPDRLAGATREAVC